MSVIMTMNLIVREVFKNGSHGKLAKYLAIWLRALNMVKGGIPEKSIKNVAQRR